MPVDGALSVLVVDDDAAIRRVLRMALETEGYEVITARDGREALEALSPTFPDIVLLDLMMPVVNGWEVLNEIRRRDLRVPVVFMSAGANARTEAVKNGADGYLAKPFDVDVLLETVTRFVHPLCRSSGRRGGPRALTDGEAAGQPVGGIVNADALVRDRLGELLAGRGFMPVATDLGALGGTAEGVLAFLRKYRPRILLFDVPPPYRANWNLYATVREAAQSGGLCCRFLATTPGKEALENEVGSTPAIELRGDKTETEAILRLFERAAIL